MGCFLNVGSTGDKVIKLQTELYKLRYYMGKIDGKYGPVTQAAVKAYQKAKKLIIDGCVGDQTWGSLFPTTPATVKPSQWVTVPSYKQDKQDTGYTCGPSSMQMALSELSITKSESELAKLMETTKQGTAHSGFFKAMKSIGLKCWDKNFSEVGWSGLADALKDKDVAVIIHGNTQGWPSYWKNSYGHYVYPIAINLVSERIRIADPTKGVVEYSLSEFKRGMDLVSQPSLIYVSK